MTCEKLMPIHHSKVVLSDLTTPDECDDMVEAIEAEPTNYIGGYKSWLSGYKCTLLNGAQNKIESIEARSTRLQNKINKEKYNELLKTNPSISWDEFSESLMY